MCSEVASYNGIDFKPQVQSPRSHIPSPIHEEQLDEQPQLEAHANSDTLIFMHTQLDTRAMLTTAQDTMQVWHITGRNIDHKISEAQRIFELWTRGLLHAWGSATYLTIELNIDATQTETELKPYLTLGPELQDQFETVSCQSFMCDPSGCVGTWNAAQLVWRQIARAMDIVEEFCLILRDGGISSLQRSYADCSLNFQLL
ncbi:hypothetical protein BD410DRAFT_808703 [Rickenella mellea]|uniref:Uncharacterized protein n=1 Tax=Rickenella mellea TaxID=50990 RepID=A0A4Y7PKX5_9AGAM|nr:hypothetical protein BD410DRAFT_808703 [Rickenella mellea]